jgi:hypothetical protein
VAGVPLPAETDVAIVGAGFGGLGMAIQLMRAGRDDFVVLERAPDVGGTWQANTYPGCQCDIPSNLYSFSFARKSDWTTAYPMREQILGYLHDCARRFGVEPHIELECELLDASWDPDRGRRDIETSSGTLSAPRAGGRTGPAERAVRARPPGPRPVRGRHLPHRELGPRPRPDRREVREGSIVDGEGAEHELDTIVFATGFAPSDPPIARGCGDVRGARCPTPGRAAPRPTSAPRSPASRTCSSSTGLTPSSGTTRSSTSSSRR